MFAWLPGSTSPYGYSRTLLLPHHFKCNKHCHLSMHTIYQNPNVHMVQRINKSFLTQHAVSAFAKQTLKLAPSKLLLLIFNYNNFTFVNLSQFLKKTAHDRQKRRFKRFLFSWQFSPAVISFYKMLHFNRYRLSYGFEFNLEFKLHPPKWLIHIYSKQNKKNCMI